MGWSVFGFKIVGLIFLFFFFSFLSEIVFNLWVFFLKWFVSNIFVAYEPFMAEGSTLCPWQFQMDFLLFFDNSKCIFTIFKVSFSVRVVALVYSLC